MEVRSIDNRASEGDHPPAPASPFQDQGIAGRLRTRTTRQRYQSYGVDDEEEYEDNVPNSATATASCPINFSPSHGTVDEEDDEVLDDVTESKPARRRKSTRPRPEKTVPTLNNLDKPRKKDPIGEVAEDVEDGIVHFRAVGNGTVDYAIDLNTRKKYDHHQLNPHSPDYGKSDPNFENPVLAEVYQGIKKFLNKMEGKNYKDRKGNPLLWNMPSLPVGLAKDEKVVVILWNYLTLEEGNPLLKTGRNSYTAEHSDRTLIANTIEMQRRGVGGDDVFFRCVLGDVNPVACPHESTLEKHVGENDAKEIRKDWKEEVLNILVESDSVIIALAAGTAEDSFAKTFGKKFEDILKKNPTKFISAAEDATKYESCPHPCSLYDPSKASNMMVKLAKATRFCTALRRMFYPEAPEVDFYLRYYDVNSSIFDICQRAFLDACSRGGTNNWKLTEAALQRKANGETLLEGDEKRIANYKAFRAAWKSHFLAKKEALRRRREKCEPLPGDDFLLENFDKYQNAGVAAARDKRDEKAGRTRDTFFLCLKCKKEGVVSYALFPKGENHLNGVLRGLPKIDRRRGGSANCVTCQKQHCKWAVVHDDEVKEVKEGRIPARIERDLEMCKTVDCYNKPYTVGGKRVVVSDSLCRNCYESGRCSSGEVDQTGEVQIDCVSVGTGNSADVKENAVIMKKTRKREDLDIEKDCSGVEDMLTLSHSSKRQKTSHRVSVCSEIQNNTRHVPPLPALPIESRAATAADEPPRAFNCQIRNVNERDDGLNLAVPHQAGNERVSILQNGARLIYVPRAQRPSLIDRQRQAPRRRIYVPQAKRPSLTDRQRPFVSPKLRNP